MSTYKKKKSQSEKICGGNYALIPLLLLIAIVPLVMRAYIYDSGLSQFDWFLNSTEELDLFLYYKGVLIILLSVTMLIVLVFTFARKLNVFKKDYWIYFILGYGGLVVLSTLLSPYREYGFSGIYEQFESMWIILSYCIITIYAYKFVQSDRDLEAIRKAIFILLAIIGLIGISQVLGFDFFESKLGRILIVPEKYATIRDKLTFNFSGSGIHQVYLTLYNPNYVGVFACLMLPVTVLLVYGSKTLIKRILWGLISLILLICTFGSGSKTFILALSAVVVVAILFCRKILLHYWKYTFAFIVLIGVCGTAYFSTMNVNLAQYVKNALIVPETVNLIDDFQVTETCATLTYKGEKLNIQYTVEDSGFFFIFSDQDGNLLQYVQLENGMIVLNDERFQNLQFGIYLGEEEDAYIPAIIINGNKLYFTKTDTGYAYVNSCGKIDEIVDAESAVFTNYTSFATGRGYIWSRTIPLLKDHFFLGSGADTFTLAFPHDDYIGRFNAGYDNQLITKPHNMYLQIGVQHGCLALVCFIIVCLIYILQSFRIYWKADMMNSRNIFGVGIMLGVIGYLVSGVANDSSVTVAPLFWAFLGIGYAVNAMNKKQTN